MKKTSSLLSKMASRNSVTNWNFFCDMIKYVPPRINRLLRQKKLFSQLQYRDRVYIAAFCYQRVEETQHQNKIGKFVNIAITLNWDIVISFY
jgi:transposase